MPGPNQPRGGNRPPPAIAAQPAAPQGEPAPPVVAVALPAIVPASAPVDVPSLPSEPKPAAGSFALADARQALQSLAVAAAAPDASDAASDAQEPAAAPQYVATVRHFVGGERGYIEPGQPIAPSAEDLLVMLAQRTIREV